MKKMKKNLQRILSLALVLTLTIGIVPMVSVETAQADSSYFEESVKNSTGWCAIKMKLYKSKSTSSNVVKTLSQGTVFRIDSESGSWWKITTSSGYTGYVQSKYCMINLPDVVPSIQYKITNATSAIYKSSSKSISGVTGEQLYTTGKVYNSKLGYKEYLVPVMYATAKKIAIAQYNALKAGVCLKIYDSYRPNTVSQTIYSKLLKLYNSNSTVKKNIDYSTGASGTKYYWGPSWFLAKSVSTHNLGCAIDVTLCKKQSDGTYKNLTMPTSMHELSTSAIKYYSSSCSKTSSNYSKEMNTNAKLLDAIFMGYTFTYKGTKYSFKSTGMSTLSSEWWHFQDNDTYSTMKAKDSDGYSFQVTKCMSK